MQLATVKNYLDITWTDSMTDAEVRDILSRAISILNRYAGTKIDFEDEKTPEAQLLLDCCFYIRNKALNEFKVNYSDELFMLRARNQVKDDAEEDTDV